LAYGTLATLFYDVDKPRGGAFLNVEQCDASRRRGNIRE